MKIKSADKLTDLKWLNLFEVTYTDIDGRNRSWQIASRSREPKCVTGRFETPDAVIIIPFLSKKKKIVIIKEYRVSLDDYLVEFPAGLVEKGESIYDTARRELAEETGFMITNFVKISPIMYSSAGLTDESVVMVYVDCDYDISSTNIVTDSNIEVKTITQIEALKLCRDTGIKFDAKAWTVLCRFGENGIL